MNHWKTYTGRPLPTIPCHTEVEFVLGLFPRNDEEFEQKLSLLYCLTTLSMYQSQVVLVCSKRMWIVMQPKIRWICKKWSFYIIFVSKNCYYFFRYTSLIAKDIWTQTICLVCSQEHCVLMFNSTTDINGHLVLL